MLARLRARQFLYAVSLLSIFFYQNCAPTDDSGDLDTQLSYAENLPFAYQARIDTLGYMSCSEISDTTYEPRAYFSFRAGAYSSSTGGLGLTPAFLQSTASYAPTDRANTFATAQRNSNTLLSLSIRSSNDFTQLWATDQVQAGQELDAFLPELDADEIAGPLGSLMQGQFINYFPGSDTQRLMEASLRFLTYENVANETRNNLTSGTSIMVVGYTATADTMDTTLRSPNDDTTTASGQDPAPVPTPTSNPNNTTAFGTGYGVSFSVPAGYASGDPRVLSAVSEKDLTTNTGVSSSWTCPANYEFMVIRPEDYVAGTVLCNAFVDRISNCANGTPTATDQQAALNAIRRVLRVEDWFVDLCNHCVIPKHTGDFCYGSTLGTRTILYGTNNCVDTSQSTTINGIVYPNGVVCPHFVSVCLRQ